MVPLRSSARNPLGRLGRQEDLDGRTHGVPVPGSQRSGVLDLVVAGDLLHAHRFVAVPDHQGAGFAGLFGEFTQHRVGHAAFLEFREQRAGNGDQAQAQAETARFRVPFHQVLLLEGGQDPGHGALVQADPVGDLGDAKQRFIGGERPQHGDGVDDDGGALGVAVSVGVRGFFWTHGDPIIPYRGRKRRHVGRGAASLPVGDGQAPTMLYSGPKGNLVMFSAPSSPTTRMSCSR